MIRSSTETAIWLSVCDADDTSMSTNSSFSTSPQKGYYASTPALASQQDDRRFNGLHHRALNSSTLISGTPYGSPSSRGHPSPLIHKKVMPQNDPAYVVLVPPSSYVVTRMWSALLYCGPVKIPESWSQRGVSSLCIQECARQLLSKRKPEEFIKVHLEVSQASMKITNTSGNILAKHRRDELYYCGLCSNDEQHFALVTLDTETSTKAELCHVFKVLPDSKLSKYCIDKSKSLRETRSGQPTPLRSCIEITDTIQMIFQNETTPPTIVHKKSIEGITDSIDYGVIRGINTFQMAPGSSDTLGTLSHSNLSPSLKRKKSNIIDLRSKKDLRSPLTLKKDRSISIPLNVLEHRSLTATSSAGHIRNEQPVHVRMGSDGSTTSSSSRNRSLPVSLLRAHPPQDIAKRISDSSLSSVSSDQSGNRSHSGSSSPKTGSGSPTPHDAHPIKLLPRKHSQTLQNGTVSPTEYSSSRQQQQQQLRRQVSCKYLRNTLYRL